jgi:iron complex transport system ATP-binding protein
VGVVSRDRLACDRATLRLGATEVLTSVTLGFRSGEVTALLGRNGAGKTTLLRGLAGLLAPAEGTIALEGRAVAAMNPRDRAARIAFAAQRPAVAADFRVEEVVALGRYALPADPGRVAAAIGELGLEPFRDRRFGALSIGEQHRVALARALAQLAPDGILLADEPFGEAERVRSRLAAYARGGGTVIASVHDPARAVALADRLVLLDGRAVRLDRSVASIEAGDLASIGEALGARLVRVAAEGVRTLAIAPPLP